MITAAAVAVALLLAPAAAPPAPLAGHVASQRGAAPSAYTGEYYNPIDEGYRRCVAQREGGHIYWLATGNGYFGTYQMTLALSNGAGWMVQPELVRTYGRKAGTRIARTLRSRPISDWNRHYADMAFWTVLNWEHRASGARHWAGGRWTCTPGMAWRGNP